jgi:putative ATP-dependent endonuclease of the OLD family
VRISRLQVEGFRSIKSIDIQLPQICALVGPNNAGKSNILHAVRRVIGPEYGPRLYDFDEEDVYGRDPDKDIEICLTFDPPLGHRKLQGVEPVSIPTLRFCWTRYKRGEKKGQRRLDQSCLKADGTVPSVQTTRAKTGQPPKFEPITNVPNEVRAQIPFIWIGTDRSLKEQLPSARWSLLRRMFEEVDRDLHSAGETVEVEGKAVPRAQRFNALLKEALALLRTSGFEQIEASIKKHALEHLGLDCDEDAIDLFFTPMDSFEFYKALDLIVKEADFAISASKMGEGMQNAIVLAILRAFEETRRKGAIIMIEEPEMFLHPQMQRSLYSTLERIGETNQIIYSTHSPHFVSVPRFSNVAIVRKDKELGTTITQSDLRVDAAKLERLRQMFVNEPAELFFAKRLLIVEGDTERLVAPVVADRHGIDLDSAGGTVIGVGGKRALLDYAELSISFGIPTGVVYDRDKADEEFNVGLETLAKRGARVWCLDPNYEGAAMALLEDDKYREIMDRYPPSVYGVSKARRGRMAATDPEMRIPPPLIESILWLGNVKEKLATPHGPAAPDDQVWE